MKTYKETAEGNFSIGSMTIPNHGGNRHHQMMIEEVALGEAEILDYEPPVISDAEQAQIDINALEATVTPRRAREATLTTGGKAWLQGVDDQIAALRTQL